MFSEQVERLQILSLKTHSAIKSYKSFFKFLDIVNYKVY